MRWSGDCSFRPRASADHFASGSLVIPMDTTYQDSGTLKAFGLVYKLLRANVPVHWAIESGKAQGGVDFTASGKDLETGATITNHGYRGGPFVIDSADRAAALPIIMAWQSKNTTAVHDMSAFDADIGKTLSRRAAHRGVRRRQRRHRVPLLERRRHRGLDGSRHGRPRSSKSYAAYPDVLTPAAIRGPTNTGSADGALMRSDGTPAYCQVTSMHYADPADEEVVREVRMWLDSGSLTHAFMECHATTTFENALNGHFLTTTGLVNDGRHAESAHEPPSRQPVRAVRRRLRRRRRLGLVDGSSGGIGAAFDGHDAHQSLHGAARLAHRMDDGLPRRQPGQGQGELSRRPRIHDEAANLVQRCRRTAFGCSSTASSRATARTRSPVNPASRSR